MMSFDQPYGFLGHWGLLSYGDLFRLPVRGAS
jgi:hypothetical protein